MSDIAELRDCRGLFDLKEGQSLLYAIETLKGQLALAQADSREGRDIIMDLLHNGLVYENGEVHEANTERAKRFLDQAAAGEKQEDLA